MHQSVVEYDVAPAAITAVPFAITWHAVPGRRARDLSPGGHPSARSERPGPAPAAIGGPAGLSSYLAAAAIAAGLIAAWAGLCVI
jgi:hypothetical protein